MQESHALEAAGNLAQSSMPTHGLMPPVSCLQALADQARLKQQPSGQQAWPLPPAPTGSTLRACQHWRKLHLPSQGPSDGAVLTACQQGDAEHDAGPLAAHRSRDQVVGVRDVCSIKRPEPGLHGVMQWAQAVYDGFSSALAVGLSSMMKCPLCLQ